MNKEVKQAFFDSLVNIDESRKISALRKNLSLVQTVSFQEKEEYLIDGWSILKELRTRVKLIKPKPIDIAFEDEVWSTFANLGFKQLNRDRNFKLPYNDDGNLTQQVDVIAIDDETVLVIECKCAESIRKSSFKETIEAIGAKKVGIINFLRKVFPETKHKIKFILATKNYQLSEQDKDRMDHFSIEHFEEEIINYYQDLSRHLGLAARFQLLGNLYAGSTIPELDNRVPAIQGKMGGHIYYSFLIEPERLLKIGYVLHRNKANKKLMPTYQRLIKKSRLNAVQEFIDDGGFFPNSIVININAERKVSFERANTQVEKSISRVGILHLPNQYRSAFIIDGQHRLYGYANSKFKETNSIPVVAFLNLERSMQVGLFMQINENQKAVPKNLRNTLNSDLLWDSENMKEQVRALKLQIAQDLGEDIDSPLFERVLVGENPKTTTRCLTLDTLSTALDRTNFFGSVTKDSIKEAGTFYTGKNDSTYKKLMPFLKGALGYVQENIADEWVKGEGEAKEGYLTINAGVYSMIVVISNIVDCLVETKQINPRKMGYQELVDEIPYFLDPLIRFLKGLSISEKDELKRSYGIAGRTKYLRKLQIAIRDSRKSFNPKGLDEELKSLEKDLSKKGWEIVRDIETFLNKDFKERLEDHYKSKWFKKGVPEAVYEEASAMAIKRNREIDNEEDEKEPWDCLYLISYRKIAVYGSNWSEIFEKGYTRPGEEKISGGKDAKTKWISELNEVRNKLSHSENITEKEFEFLSDLNDWLIDNTIQNSLVAD